MYPLLRDNKIYNQVYEMFKNLDAYFKAVKEMILRKRFYKIYEYICRTEFGIYKM